MEANQAERYGSLAALEVERRVTGGDDSGGG